MSCPLLHVFVLLNQPRRSAFRFGEALRRVIRSPPLVLCLLASCSLAPPLPVPPLCSPDGPVSDEMPAACLRLIAAVGLLRVPRSACVLPSAYRPASSTRVAGRGTGAVVACFFRVSTACRSRRHVGPTGLVCLLVPMSVGRFRPAMCYARILWIASIAVVGAALPWYIDVVS